LSAITGAQNDGGVHSNVMSARRSTSGVSIASTLAKKTMHPLTSRASSTSRSEMSTAVARKSGKEAGACEKEREGRTGGEWGWGMRKAEQNEKECKL
jgi:hypothetical protein